MLEMPTKELAILGQEKIARSIFFDPHVERPRELTSLKMPPMLSPTGWTIEPTADRKNRSIHDILHIPSNRRSVYIGMEAYFIWHFLLMRNLYSMISTSEAISRLLKAGLSKVGHQPPQPGTFPVYAAPSVRNAADGERVIVSMR